MNFILSITASLLIPLQIFSFGRDTIELLFIGDVMQHMPQINSAKSLAAKKQNDSAKFDYSNMFKHIQPWINRADFAVANLEFPMGYSNFRGYPLFKGPAAVAAQAKKSGIDLALLANNHIADDGVRGMECSLRVCDSLALAHTGIYRSSEEKEKAYPLIVQVKGCRIAFINFTYSTNGNAVPPPFAVNMMDSVEVKKACRRAVEAGSDLIVALPHWGIEYNLHPSREQCRWASMLLRNGVQVIIGTHPHVAQDAVISGEEGICFYSLGNYISNQNDPLYTRLELMVSIRVEKNLFTGGCRLLEPEWEWLWCFKKGEFENDYTVVPVSKLIDHPNREKYSRYIKCKETVSKNLHL